MLNFKIGKALIFGLVALGLLSFCSIIGLIADNKTLITIGVIALYSLIGLMIYTVFNVISNWSKQVGDTSVDLEAMMKQFEEEAAKISKGRKK